MVQYGKRNDIFWIACISLIQYCSCAKQNATHDAALVKLTEATVSSANNSVANVTTVSTAHLPAVSASVGHSKESVHNFTKEPVINATLATLTKHESNTTNTTKKQCMEGGCLPLKKYEGVSDKPSAETTRSKQDKPPRKEQKHISARKGAILPLNETTPLSANVSTTSTTTTTSTTPKPTKRPHKMKPFYTMVKGDKFSQDSESFIESSTTGKDYVLPLVLIIFAVPGFVFLVKFLYRRGTEFTERQQYHRMYLIDGDYQPPFLERWKRLVICFLFGENCQTDDRRNPGLNSRTNFRNYYNSF